MDFLALDLPRRGLATWNVEYRRVGMGGGGTVTVGDVDAAVAHLEQITGIDPGQYAVVGHSAGGHLALLAGREAAHSHRPPGLVVAMGAVSDLVAGQAQGLGEGAVSAFLTDSDAAELSPRHLLPLGAPTLLAHGSADDRVPADQSRDYTAAAVRAGDSVELQLDDGGGHFDVLDPDGEAWRRVAERIAGALRA